MKSTKQKLFEIAMTIIGGIVLGLLVIGQMPT